MVLNRKFVSAYSSFENKRFILKYSDHQLQYVQPTVQKILDQHFTLQERLLLTDGKKINTDTVNLSIYTDSLNQESLLRHEKRYLALIRKLDKLYLATSNGKFFYYLINTSKLFRDTFNLLKKSLKQKANELGVRDVVMPLSDMYLEIFRQIQGSLEN